MTRSSRASEAERKLAAAVGQLRELHRRVGVLEQNQQRPSQAIRLDGVGDHIQRIFEEAREGAEAMRQGAEVELAELRQKTIAEARSIVAGARKKAEEIELETERRQREELQRLNDERSRAASQLTYLHEQRKNAVSELLRIREVIDSTIAEVSADLRPGTASEKSRGESPSSLCRGRSPDLVDPPPCRCKPRMTRTHSRRRSSRRSTRCSIQWRSTRVTSAASRPLDLSARTEQGFRCPRTRTRLASARWPRRHLDPRPASSTTKSSNSDAHPCRLRRDGDRLARCKRLDADIRNMLHTRVFASSGR